MSRDQIVEGCKEALAEFEAEKSLPLEVRRVRLEPGDTLVLRAPHHLTRASIENLTAGLRKVFGDTPVLVLEGGLDLEVISKEKTNG